MMMRGMTVTNRDPSGDGDKPRNRPVERADDAELSRGFTRREEVRREAEGALRQMLEGSEASGFSASSVDEIWAEAEAAYLRRTVETARPGTK